MQSDKNTSHTIVALSDNKAAQISFSNVKVVGLCLFARLFVRRRDWSIDIQLVTPSSAYTSQWNQWSATWSSCCVGSWDVWWAVVTAAPSVADTDGLLDTAVTTLTTVADLIASAPSTLEMRSWRHWSHRWHRSKQQSGRQYVTSVELEYVWCRRRRRR